MYNHKPKSNASSKKITKQLTVFFIDDFPQERVPKTSFFYGLLPYPHRIFFSMVFSLPLLIPPPPPPYGNRPEKTVFFPELFPQRFNLFLKHHFLHASTRGTMSFVSKKSSAVRNTILFATENNCNKVCKILCSI